METQLPDDDIESASVEPHRRLWLIVFAVVVVVGVVPGLFSASPRASSLFPHVKPHYDSWSVDRHRAAANSCLDCHLEPGIGGVVTYPLTFYGEVLSSLSGGLIKPPPMLSPSDKACRRSGCHSLNRLESLSRQLRVNHRMHAEEAEVPCHKCHPGVGHNGADGRFVQPPMSMCKECHKKQMSDCKYCHLANTLPVNQDAP